MAIRDAATLRTFFETGDYPTQAQFGDLIDSTDNHLITGDVTIDLNNVATINPAAITGTKIFSTSQTRTAIQGSGTVTISTTFLPKLAFITGSITSQGDASYGSFGRSNGTTNSCSYTIFGGGLPFIAQSNTFSLNTTDITGDGFTAIINNFTSTSFDIVYTIQAGGIDITIKIDIIG